jgi:hypothetical protein
LSAKVAASAPPSLSQKLLDALNDGRKASRVPLNKLPQAARADANEGKKQFDGVDAQKFKYGNDTFYAVRKSADDAFEIYDFYSRAGKFAGTQEIDF